jgi:hypothetical protein
MLSKIVSTGVFVALSEFVGQHGDGASIVRSLHDAGLLAVDASTASRRVHTEKIEGVDVVGVVLPCGGVPWIRRVGETLAGRSSRRRRFTAQLTRTARAPAETFGRPLPGVESERAMGGTRPTGVLDTAGTCCPRADVQCSIAGPLEADGGSFPLGAVSP